MDSRMASAFVFLLVVASFVTNVSATIYPPYFQTSGGDYYQVVFDGESETSVLAKFVKTNIGNETLDEITFEIPGDKVIMKYMFQEIHNKTCNEYGCYVDWAGTYSPLTYSSEELSESVKYTVKLKEGIEPAMTGTIIIYYKTMGYVDKFVNYGFDFETAKSPYDTQYIRVAISVDSDLYLRGGSTSVDYKNNFAGVQAVAEAKPSGEIGGEYASQLRTYSNNIQYASGYVKEKRNLDPWESFHVKGTYNHSDLWFLTYLKEIVIVLLALAAVKIFILERIMNLFTGVRFGSRRRGSDGKLSRVVVGGFISAVALLVVWWLFFSLVLNFINYLDWRFQYFAVLFMLMGLVLSILIFVLPSFLIGKKYGTAEGLLTLVSAIVWVILILSVAFLLFGYNEPIYYYGTRFQEVVATKTG